MIIASKCQGLLLEEEVMSVVGMEANSGLMSVYPLLTTTPEFIFSKEPDPDSNLHVQTRIKIVLI